jgi:hypothetical protein
MLTRAEQYQWTKAVCFAVGGRFLGLRGFIARWVTGASLRLDWRKRPIESALGATSRGGPGRAMADLDANELDQVALGIDYEQTIADEFHCDRLLDRVAQVPVKALGSAHTVRKRIFR